MKRRISAKELTCTVLEYTFSRGYAKNPVLEGDRQTPFASGVGRGVLVRDGQFIDISNNKKGEYPESGHPPSLIFSV